MPKTPPIWAVIMAGGSGTRFWPESRAGRPKQFLPPGGLPPGKKSEKKTAASLLAQSANRMNGLVPPERILIIGSVAHRRLIAETVPDIPRRNVILEPEGRNTAPCLCLAAHIIEGREPGAVMAAFPADHHIARPGTLRRLIRAAARLAGERDAVVTLGIKPTGPETGYGYIERGKKLPVPGKTEAYGVRRFTEKPTLARARKFVSSGHFYWNGGIFIWRAERAIEEIGRRLPETSRHIERAARALNKRKAAEFARAFKAAESISIDYAVMEKLRDIIVLPADMGWNDVGSWAALREVLPLDKKGNLWMIPDEGNVLADETRGLIVRSSKPLIAALGVENLIVIETQGALLLCHADRAQSVGDLVKQLKAKGLGQHL
ncbi:MAG: NTP transferase domain-containing protein [Nitrospinaceae bacterium]|nr:NTP transferase domain-containing protein [Nitrospinaceae bacterium]MBT3434648.1 NTP transferase domain-containing protein [Nitrospinaceae bacterium]MBT3820054.1 NTP transferase domain-containing protein [Nitrospinaceae bacterium]MBT5366965.1 NTP transferase domain-containing protein [Nitrospinaceae bacterium]MBT5946033.1 NTP transferase domain-containing protein [Nitrospinaceae bacterium]